MPSVPFLSSGKKTKFANNRDAARNTPPPRIGAAVTPRRSFQTDHSEGKVKSFSNPFGTPSVSTNASLTHLSQHSNYGYFHSRRIDKRQFEQSWSVEKDSRRKWQTLIPLLGIIIGLGIAIFMVYDGWTSVPVHQYCPVYEDDFSSGQLDPKIWTKEVQVGGFGNGQFDETTNTDENVYIVDGILTIKPTMQDAQLINNNNVINLTALGTCTGEGWNNCIATTNTTNGTIVNPVKSARINTKNGATIKYGRVEVVAKMPRGDWLWPAIWMLPKDNVYGDWPRSGEIDIAESRGNNHSYHYGGRDIYAATLHWGPDQTNDAWWRTFNKAHASHTEFSDTFHTFGLEWTEKYLYMYLDTRLLQVQYANFGKTFWQWGSFPLTSSNGSALVDPWSQTGRKSTPFDQEFYLILNVAVGGTNGWFIDGAGGKPWVDASATAKRDFWLAKDQWLPTWTDPTLQVKSIKMWQLKGYNGC